MKRKFNIVDCAIAIIFALFLSFYIIPKGISYFLNKSDHISDGIKQQILLAGKTYLDNNKDKSKVSVEDLYNAGYLLKNDTYYMDCFPSISTVNKDNSRYYLNLRCVNDDSTLTLLQ